MQYFCTEQKWELAPNYVQILHTFLCQVPPECFLFIYSHFNKYLSWLEIISFQRPISKSISRLTTLYFEGLCFKCSILRDAVLSDAPEEKWHNQKPPSSRLFLDVILLPKTETFIFKLECNQTISHLLFIYCKKFQIGVL